MEIILCLCLGYLLGCLNPAALIGKLKSIDLRQVGTQNLGASNVLLSIGKMSGFLVMVLDIAKGYFSVKLARAIFPLLSVAGLVAGIGAILGHIFPFYLRFQGGKGLAAFGGLVLAYDPWIFLILLVIGIIAILIVNYAYAMPMSAGFLFPVLVWLRSRSFAALALSAISAALVIVKHWSNIARAHSGGEMPIRQYLKENFFRKKQKV